MKFFWKIFFCTMFISVISFSVGGYILVQNSFHSMLQNEISAAYDMGDVIYYALSGELQDKLHEEKEIRSVQKLIRSTSANIGIYQSGQRLQFAICDNSGTEVYSSLEQSFSKDVVAEIEDRQIAYLLRQDAATSRYYIQAFRPITLLNENHYIETQRDVTPILKSQKEQYQLLITIISIMLLAAGVTTFVAVHFLMKSVGSLTRTTKAIAAGNLTRRVQVSGSDEFAELSRSFNQMADDLQEKIKELEDSAENRELFVAAFSHELKTPLTSIIGYADILRGKQQTPERTELCANYIFSEGKRLEALSLRLLSLIVIKNQKLNLRGVYLPTFFDDIYTIVAPQLKHAQIELVWEISPGTMEMEPELMKTVFINLIDNARKAIDAQGLIQVTGEQKQDRYTVTIQDNGRGMTQEDLAKIKEAFFMVDKSRSRKQGGAGLGLAICDEILRLHGFQIQYDSAPGSGTAVTVTMKEAQEDAKI